MGNCNVCYAWTPKQWDKWHYIDATAPCLVHKNSTSRDHTCTYFSLTPPTDIQRSAPQREQLFTIASSFLDAEDMEGFDTVEMDASDVEALPVFSKRQAFEKPKVDIKKYEHQEETFERFKDATEMGIFFEQGLGKSAVSLRIAAHKFKKGDIDACLIVAPNGVHKQWFIEQVPLWLDYYQCRYEAQLLGGKAGKNSRPFRDPKALQVVCVNIDTFSTPKKWEEIALWANYKKTFIILDEATTIKSVKSQRTQRMLYAFNTVHRRGKAILASIPKSVARAVLTGTPTTEGPFDLWAIFEFLRPNYFKRNYYSFQNHYGLFYTMVVESMGDDGKPVLRSFPSLIKEPVWEQIRSCKSYGEAFANFGVTEDTYRDVVSQERYSGPYRHADELKAAIAPVSVFKTLEECVDMPGKNYERKILDMNPEQARMYREMEDELLTQYGTYESSAASRLIAYIRLQQITSGFLSATKIVDEETDIIPSRELIWIGNTNPKLEQMYSLIETETPVCPVIVITRFSAEAARIYDDLYKKMPCMLYTGWKKVGNMEDFQAGKFDVLIANERAISRGFNLQISHSTHFYSNTFSLEDRLQTESRTYRIGQKNKVRYTDYLYLDTVDMKIVASLRQKRELLDYMRGVSVKDFLTQWDEVAETEYADVRF